MKHLFTLLFILGLYSTAYSQKVFYHKCSKGDTLQFRFELPKKMKLKIYQRNKLVKEYEFKGTKDLKMITKLRRVIVYANEIEMRFYLFYKRENIEVPSGMPKKKVFLL